MQPHECFFRTLHEIAKAFGILEGKHIEEHKRIVRLVEEAGVW